MMSENSGVGDSKGMVSFASEIPPGPMQIRRGIPAMEGLIFARKGPEEIAQTIGRMLGTEGQWHSDAQPQRGNYEGGSFWAETGSFERVT
jgi:hypothetical protein